MESKEAAFFYGDYRDLIQEFNEAELSDNFDNRVVPQEFLSCNRESNDLQ